ncbi:hypothetical protein E2542_SST00728 [Spatholobus suberectus]|nr:hypothetical protein E2542_SST00728 [Spatholobus suberectus]
MEKLQYGKFRYKGFPFGDELTILFKDVVTSGKYGCAPSSRTFPTNIDENDDVYRPSLDEVDCVDLEEGSGDNEEIIAANVESSVGVSTELGNMNLSFSHGNNSDLSHGKRKKG